MDSSYDNPKRKKSWVALIKLHHRQSPISTPNIYSFTLVGLERCIVLYYDELLQLGETVMADRYQQQLTNLSDALEEKKSFTGQGCCKLILLHDNAQRHVGKATQNHIALGWELLPHASYSLDMAPPDYYLFDRCSII